MAHPSNTAESYYILAVVERDFNYVKITFLLPRLRD